MAYKKLIAVLLLLTVAFGLIACATPPAPANPTAPPAEVTPVAATEPPATATPAAPTATPAPTAAEPTPRPAPHVEVELGENEYLGVGSGGMHGRVFVKVKMDGEKIVSIEVVEHEETQGIGTIAIDKLPEVMVKAQSAEVDVVAGATLTSNALIKAVADALSQVE